MSTGVTEAVRGGGPLGAQFVKFALVGLLGVSVNLGAFALLSAVGAPLLAASAVAFGAAVANNYLWNTRWTFAGSGVGSRLAAGRFAAVSLAGLILGLIVVHGAASGGAPALLAQAIAIAIVTPVDFVGNRAWAFNPAARALAVAPAWRAIALAWLWSRALVLGTAIGVQLLRWPHPTWYASFNGRPLAVLQAWDGRWYRLVASRGYVTIPHHQSDTAFFPLYPALMNGARFAGLSTWTAGLLLANLLLLAALIALYELVRTWLPEQTARRAGVYAAWFPVGYVFSMAYPESLVLGAIAGAGAAAARRRWTLAAVLAAVAAAGCPEGTFVTIPLLALALRRDVRTNPGERTAALAAAASAPATLGAVALYQRLIVGDPIAFSHVQAAWGRRLSADGFVRAVHELSHASGNNLWLARDAAFCVLYVLVLAVAWRGGVPWPWVVAALATVLLPLETGSFTSDARFGLLAPAVFAGLAHSGRSRVVNYFLLAAMPVLLVGATATILMRWP